MRKWKGLTKIAEECGELTQELMKLHSYPNGVHPRRKANLIRSTEDEIADVYAILDYFVAKNKLNAEKIKRRRAYKVRKWVKRWGNVNLKKQPKKRSSKKSSVGRSHVVDVSSINATS
jgi:NTP pyrophosphatase (non-canonical NTP hydrolase)